MDQVLKSRLVPQRIEDRLHLQINQAVVAVFEGSLEPFDGGFVFAESGKNQRLAVIRCMPDL